VATAKGSFAETLESGSRAAHRFARTRGHDAAEPASIVMTSLADAIERIPGAAPRVTRQLTEIRFAAKRLQRADRLSFSLPRWIKEGLTGAMDALETLAAKDEASSFWIARGRASVTAIDEKSTLTFQRALVQDAIRTALDAFVVLGRGMGACEA
jgi:hypothetical protein